MAGVSERVTSDSFQKCPCFAFISGADTLDFILKNYPGDGKCLSWGRDNFIVLVEGKGQFHSLGGAEG